jgi:hypothetical protein
MKLANQIFHLAEEISPYYNQSQGLPIHPLSPMEVYNKYISPLMETLTNDLGDLNGWVGKLKIDMGQAEQGVVKVLSILIPTTQAHMVDLKNILTSTDKKASTLTPLQAIQDVKRDLSDVIFILDSQVRQPKTWKQIPADMQKKILVIYKSLNKNVASLEKCAELPPTRYDFVF